MNKSYVQERITELRLSRNLSEYKLSRELGHSKGYIQSISSGKNLPSVTALLEICDYFKITPKEFFNEAEPGSELVCDLMAEIRKLNSDEQYSLYHFLTARRRSNEVQP